MARTDLSGLAGDIRFAVTNAADNDINKFDTTRFATPQTNNNDVAHGGGGIYFFTTGSLAMRTEIVPLTPTISRHSEPRLASRVRHSSISMATTS